MVSRARRRRNVGVIEIDKNNQGQLIFTDPNQENILALFDQLEVTVEPDNDPNPTKSSGEVAASSIFPPLALIHVRHVLVSFHDAPEGIALKFKDYGVRWIRYTEPPMNYKMHL